LRVAEVADAEFELECVELVEQSVFITGRIDARQNLGFANRV
jgi:hypothetical protein